MRDLLLGAIEEIINEEAWNSSSELNNFIGLSEDPPHLAGAKQQNKLEQVMKNIGIWTELNI